METFLFIAQVAFISKPHLVLVQLATEEAKNFRDRNIFIILVPNKAEVQKPQETPNKEAANEVSVSVEA